MQGIIDIMNALGLTGMPLVILIMFVFFCSYFGKDISKLLGRLKKGKLPGIGEFETQEEPPETKIIDKESQKEKLIDDLSRQKDTLMIQVDRLTQELEGKEEAHKKFTVELTNAIMEVVKIEREETSYWKFEFLSLFLVPITQAVLYRIGEQADGVKRKEYELFWWLQTPDNVTFIEALLFYKLINEENGILRITDEGRAFLKHLETKFGKYYRQALELSFTVTLKRPGKTITELVEDVSEEKDTEGLARHIAKGRKEKTEKD